MKQITNFTEVGQVLQQYVRPANEPGGYTLDRMQQLMAFLGNPQDTYKVVHVAGTSGKTSTCYYIAAMLRAAGHTVGHTVSPHVDQVNERAQINLEPLAEADYCRQLGTFLDIIEQSNIVPSYFELLVAFAYWLFAEQKVEYAVVEVGLGGLLDGTNVVTRADKVCVITDIGLDHTQILGNTVTEIAAHKAGIIHKNNVVFMHAQAAEILDVVKKRCIHELAELHILGPVPAPEFIRGLPLFQQRNWSLAVATTNYVLQRDGSEPLSVQQLDATLNTYIPARMETITYKDKTIIMDGSHNEQKIGALVASIEAKYPDQQLALLVSFGENKTESVQGSLRLLTEIGTSIILTEFSLAQDHARRAISVETLETYAQQAGFSETFVNKDPQAALQLLLNRPETVLLVTGSFYLLNHIRLALV